MLWIHLQTVFSFRAYHRLAFATRWHLIGFLVYLGLLSLLIFYWFTGGFIRKQLPIALKNFPQVTFEKGILTEPQTPVYAPIPGTDFKIGFDATRQTPPSLSELVQHNLLALFTKDALYIPNSHAVQEQKLSENFSFTTSQEFLTRQKPLLASALRVTSLMIALVLIPLVLFFDFCLAGAVGFFFNILTRRHVPISVIFRWAIWLLGPLTLLWYVQLWYPIPLFTLAQVILCIIYMQQIFNLLPEKK